MTKQKQKLDLASYVGGLFIAGDANYIYLAVTEIPNTSKVVVVTTLELVDKGVNTPNVRTAVRVAHEKTSTGALPATTSTKVSPYLVSVLADYDKYFLENNVAYFVNLKELIDLDLIAQKVTGSGLEVGKQVVYQGRKLFFAGVKFVWIAEKKSYTILAHLQSIKGSSNMIEAELSLWGFATNKTPVSEGSTRAGGIYKEGSYITGVILGLIELNEKLTEVNSLRIQDCKRIQTNSLSDPVTITEVSFNKALVSRDNLPKPTQYISPYLTKLLAKLQHIPYLHNPPYFNNIKQLIELDLAAAECTGSGLERKKPILVNGVKATFKNLQFRWDEEKESYKITAVVTLYPKSFPKEVPLGTISFFVEAAHKIKVGDVVSRISTESNPPMWVVKDKDGDKVTLVRQNTNLVAGFTITTTSNVNDLYKHYTLPDYVVRNIIPYVPDDVHLDKTLKYWYTRLVEGCKVVDAVKSCDLAQSKDFTLTEGLVRSPLAEAERRLSLFGEKPKVTMFGKQGSHYVEEHLKQLHDEVADATKLVDLMVETTNLIGKVHKTGQLADLLKVSDFYHAERYLNKAVRLLSALKFTNNYPKCD